jgi:hypothetical protein
MGKPLLGLVVLWIGCGGDARPAPSCFDAFSRFYSNGCTFVDLNTGQPIPQSTIVAQCQNLASAAPANCRDELNVWLECINDSSASGNRCNCSSEQMTLLECR